jgi:TolB-like protein
MASLLALAVAISWTLWKGKVLPEKVGTTKGVPVLPFLSPDPDNAYFTEGIHEEILARLATIHDLKVISAIPRSATYSKLTRIRLREVVLATVARVRPRSVLSGLQGFPGPP